MHWWPSLPTAPESPTNEAAAFPAAPTIPTPVVQYDPTLWGGGYGYRPSLGGFGSPWVAASPQPVQQAPNPLRKISSEPALDLLPAAREASNLLSHKGESLSKSPPDRRPSVGDFRQQTQQQQQQQQHPAAGSSSPSLCCATRQQQQGATSGAPGASTPGTSTPPLPPQGPTGWLRGRRVSSSVSIGMAAA